MATHSSILAWKIPWMEDPDRLQSMGSQRVRHNWATSLSLLPLTSCVTLGLPGGSDVKSLPAKWETQVQSLGQEDPLEKKDPLEKEIPTPVFLPGKSHGWRSLAGYIPWVSKSQTQLSNFTFAFIFSSCVTLSTLVNLSVPPFSSSVTWYHHHICLLAH